MMIDLTTSEDLYPHKIGSSHYINNNKIKSTKLLTYLNQVNIQMQQKYNFVLIPMTIYNIIENSEYFSKVEFEMNEGIKKVGYLGDFECYLDMYLPPDEILVSWDKSRSRDIKIENLLSNTILEKEKKIKVIP